MKLRAKFTLPVVVALVALSTHSAGWAQGLEDAKWQRKNDRGNRFEGRIDIPVSRPDMELLSFVGFREDFYEDDVNLNVRFYLPGTQAASVIARELTERKQYGMMAKQEEWLAGDWNTWGPWPTGEYLVPNGIPGWNLGYIVLLDDKATLAPAFVYHTDPPKSIENYQVDLRANSRLEKITYSVLRGETSLRKGGREVEEEAGEPIRLGLDVRGISPGPLRVSIRGKYRDKPGGVTREYRFHHQPLVSAMNGDASGPAQ